MRGGTRAARARCVGGVGGRREGRREESYGELRTVDEKMRGGEVRRGVERGRRVLVVGVEWGERGEWWRRGGEERGRGRGRARAGEARGEMG